MVTALKLDDFIAACKTTRQADGRHGGLCARADQAHLLHARQYFDDFFSDAHFAFGRRTKRQTIQSHFTHGFYHFRMGMADNRRAPRAHVINVLLIVFIPHIRALGFFDKTRHAAHAAKSAHRRIHPTRDDLFGLFK